MGFERQHHIGGDSGISRVLIVEDHPMIAELVETRLRIEGMRPTKCLGGNEAIAALQATDFDLIILDIMMPEVDGYDVLKFVRQNDRTKHLPVILLTAKSTQDDIEKGLGLGADYYITKPFSGADLIRKVKLLLEHQRLATGHGHQRTRQLGTAHRRLAGTFQVPADTLLLPGKLHLAHVQVADDHPEQVVVVVREATDELADRVVFLRLAPVFLHRPLRADVERDDGHLHQPAVLAQDGIVVALECQHDALPGTAPDLGGNDLASQDPCMQVVGGPFLTVQVDHLR